MSVRILKLKGKRFGRLLVVGYAGSSGRNGHSLWRCLCSCGTQTTVPSNNLLAGNTRSCGCGQKGGRGPRENLAGKKFGELLVVAKAGARQGWRCLCSCGRECFALAVQLRRGTLGQPGGRDRCPVCRRQQMRTCLVCGTQFNGPSTKLTCGEECRRQRVNAVARVWYQNQQQGDEHGGDRQGQPVEVPAVPPPGGGSV
jgi:hypothetical protein